MSLKLKQFSAFSITEVLVAMMVFAVGILSVIQVIPMHRKLSRISAKSTVAAFLAQEKTEEVFSLLYTDIAVGAYEARTAVASTGDFAEYERETIVDYVDSNLASSATDLGLKKITSTIYWQEGSTEKSESIVTLKAIE